jgi:hypothetical protein
VAAEPTHTVFTVRTAPHEQSAQRAAWRVKHAAETITLVWAWFTCDILRTPIQAPDGTFEIHAPSRSTLDFLRELITEHEGMIIVAEDEAPGEGLIAAVSEGTTP